jgi:hypothetical protein
MKTLRKNVDLSSGDIAILQIEATLKGYGSLKPFLELVLHETAQKSLKAKPNIYKVFFEKKKIKLITSKEKKS